LTSAGKPELGTCPGAPCADGRLILGGDRLRASAQGFGFPLDPDHTGRLNHYGMCVENLFIDDDLVESENRRVVLDDGGVNVGGEVRVIGLELIDAGIAAAVPTEAVLADAGYGDQPRFLDGLEIRGLPYLVGVASTTRFRLTQDVEEYSGEQPAPPYQGQGRPRRARRLEDRIPSREANALLEELLQDAWQAITWREGTKGNLTKEFTRVRVYRVGRRGKPLPTAGWLIGQRPLPGQQGESKYCFAWGLDSLSLQDQVVLAHNRWVIERFYQDAKGELGLDDYEGRFWTGLHRHVALVMMAHSFLSIRRNHGLPPQTDSTDAPRQFPSATSVAGFPP